MQKSMLPPWLKFPNIPLGSMGWRMGRGEDYWYEFRDWFLSQDSENQSSYSEKFPEPESWVGFYARLRETR